MRIEVFHASKYGNGAKVAQEFATQMAARGVSVRVHLIRHTSPADVARADLYLFSSPARAGKPIGSMQRFLRRLDLPLGTRYAILTTELAPRPDKRTGRIPADGSGRQAVRLVMNRILRDKGLVGVLEDTIFVTGMKGPLEDRWQEKVASFVARIPMLSSPAR